MPEENVKAVTALIASKVEKHGMAAKATLLGQIAMMGSYKFVMPYRRILVEAAKSDDPKLAQAADGALKMYDLAEMSVVAGDPEAAFLKGKVTQYAPVKLEPDDSHLSETNKKVKALLIKSAQAVDHIFWRQYTEDGLALRAQLENSSDPLDKLRLRLLKVNYGRFDNTVEGKPAFMGRGNLPPGSSFYPLDMTMEEFHTFIKNHPEVREEFEKPNTLIRRHPEKGLIAIPYEEIYKEELGVAAKYLEEAAALTNDPALKKYLIQKAKDLLSGDYFAGDRDWLALEESILDIIIGYTEFYDDNAELKASFEALVLLKDPVASQRYASYKDRLQEFQSKLPVAEALKDEEVIAAPIGVFDAVYMGGDANQNIKPYAVNLPNTMEVREKYGNRFILLQNLMQAKAQKILIPIAQRIMDPSQAALVREDEFADHGICHEFAHSLGPKKVVDRKTGKKTALTPKEALQDPKGKGYYKGLEEAKGDVLALFNLRWDNLEEEQEMAYYANFTASIFRSIRFGLDDSHAEANLLIGTFLQEKGAIVFNPATGRWKVVSVAKMREAIKELSNIILEIQGYGDLDRAKAFAEKYLVMTPGITATLAELEGIPIDIELIQPEEKANLTPLATKAQKALSGIMLLKPGQKAFIIYDQSKKELGEAFVAGAKALGAQVDSYLLPESRFEQGALEEIVAKINASGYAVYINIFEARPEEVNSRVAIINAERGTEAFVGHSPGLTKEMLALPVDYAVMKEAKSRLLTVLKGAEKVVITTKLGTNLEVKLGNRKWFDDISIKSEGIVNIPNGEMYYAALEDGANGTLTVDGSVGGIGLLPSPLAIEFKNGKVVSMKWLDPKFQDPDNYLGRIKAALKIDSMASIIGEFGIGLAPYGLVGNVLQDEKASKTIHIATGRNKSEGGKNNSGAHVDFIVKDPTVEVHYPEETNLPSQTILLEGNLTL